MNFASNTDPGLPNPSRIPDLTNAVISKAHLEHAAGLTFSKAKRTKFLRVE